jgi:WD40 repeat protein
VISAAWDVATGRNSAGSWAALHASAASPGRRTASGYSPAATRSSDTWSAERQDSEAGHHQRHGHVPPDGGKVVTCGRREARVWDVGGQLGARRRRHGRWVAMLPGAESAVGTDGPCGDRPRDVSWSEDGLRPRRRAYHGGSSRSLLARRNARPAGRTGWSLRRRDQEAGQGVQGIPCPRRAFSPDGRRLISGGADGCGHLGYRKRQGIQRQRARGCGTGATFLPGSRQTVTCSNDRALQLWNVRR